MVTDTMDFCPPPGVYEGVPFNEYLAWDAVSKSRLWHMRFSPAHYKWEREHPKQPTAAMDSGTLLDLAIFEGVEAMEAACMIRPPGNGNLKIVKAAKEQAGMEGLQLVSEMDFHEVLQRAAQVKAHPEAAELLDRCQHQVSFVWIDPATGVTCKGRADLAEREGVIVADLKSTRCADPDLFARDVATYGYQVQAAGYLDGLTLATGRKYTDFRFICCETTPPYLVNVLPLDEPSIVAGRSAYQRWLYCHKKCTEANDWPGYGLNQSPIQIPMWALRAEGIDPDMRKAYE